MQLNIILCDKLVTFLSLYSGQILRTIVHTVNLDTVYTDFWQ
ncbi:hypothetical protein BuS5_02695 [Desulfosarcina sp. BuS5]|nr:hypothetical protein BuS5_02695 [Desulfosarcina sp. BuS5]